ncbi:uncharacterized protein LOC124633516 [Helicoverpa zea]|uniref:uncharacterized protein LOC124633516 n=1 Tax=Helicoverpa zea TaxID=7113 RepID=UPI001F578EED|nr:uncharacterized protein LOC124633516 [Helicoverpa zea]XP_047024721.1 uncharacterized protein LOC124633516 [Helicoverpa zea]
MADSPRENKRLDMSAVEIQQEYYEATGDADWELYEKKDRRFLLQKIAVALCGPPSVEGNLTDCLGNSDSELKLQGYDARDEETCMNVFKKILEQDKYSHNAENLIISVLRVVCVIPSREIKFYQITPRDYWLNLHTKKGKSVHILVFHVFSIRKCISKKPGVKGCKIFIDHDARVYETWSDYLSQNKLPKCVMVVPQNGEYSGIITKEGEMPKVVWTVQASPELGPGARVLNVADNVSTAASVGAIVAVVGSVFATPVVAPVLVGTAVGVASVTGVYSIGRSIGKLVDRARHEQSIGLKNMEARSNWINIIISGVGISFTTAGKLLSWAAASGRNVKILMSALDFLKYTNIATGFIGVVNGLGDMIYKMAKYGERPTKLEIFQFTTSLLFLGVGVMSNQTAQDIVQDAQAQKINEFRESLSSNNRRKIFDKVTAETRRIKGTIEGNTDVIRAIKTIENKDQFFGKLSYMNKAFNKNKVRISLAPDGKVLINNQHRVSAGKMFRMGEQARAKLLAKYGPAKVTTKNAPTRIYPSCGAAGSTNVSLKELVCNIRPEEIIKISTFIINLSKVDLDFIIDLLCQISEDLHNAFLLVCTELIISLIPSELDFINSIFPDWKRRLVLFIFNHLKSKITIDDNDSEFVAGLKTYIRDGRVNRDTLLNLKKKVLEHFSKLKHDKESRNKTWVEGDEYMNKFSGDINTLQVGQRLIVGPHTILVKQVTVDNFEKWFEEYSQKECDFFTELCFRIISLLTVRDFSRLNDINPDEDVLMRVSTFLRDRFQSDKLDMYISSLSDINDYIAISAKREIMIWCGEQHLRPRFTCVKCGGMTFFQK